MTWPPGLVILRVKLRMFALTSSVPSGVPSARKCGGADVVSVSVNNAALPAGGVSVYVAPDPVAEENADETVI